MFEPRVERDVTIPRRLSNKRWVELFVKFERFALYATSMSSSFAGNSQKVLSSEKAPPIDLSVLQNASKLVDEQFTKDSQAIPELGDTLRELLLPSRNRILTVQ